MSSVAYDAPLAPLTTLRIGGPAKRLITVETDDEFVAAVRECDTMADPPLLLAGGSNVVLPDAGLPGTVIRVATRGASYGADGLVRAAAGESWDDVVAASLDAGLSGLECLSGIPGSVGATPVQNVGAYGVEVADLIESVEVYDRGSGRVADFAPGACGFGYRTSRFKRTARWVVVSVTFRLAPSGESAPIRYAELARTLGVNPGARASARAAREAVLELRRGKGMVLDPGDPDSMSVGSFFTNPVVSQEVFTALAERAGEPVPSFPVSSFPAGGGDDGVKLSAAWLIEHAGFTRGYGDGRVGISTKHSLALVNRGGGGSVELLELAGRIRAAVLDRFGVELHPEPVIVGQRPSWADPV